MLGCLPPTHFGEKKVVYDKIFQQANFSDISALFFTEAFHFENNFNAGIAYTAISREDQLLIINTLGKV